jgi:hypothetical protein
VVLVIGRLSSYFCVQACLDVVAPRYSHSELPGCLNIVTRRPGQKMTIKNPYLGPLTLAPKRKNQGRRPETPNSNADSLNTPFDSQYGPHRSICNSTTAIALHHHPILVPDSFVNEALATYGPHMSICKHNSSACGVEYPCSSGAILPLPRNHHKSCYVDIVTIRCVVVK